MRVEPSHEPLVRRCVLEMIPAFDSRFSLVKRRHSGVYANDVDRKFIKFNAKEDRRAERL